MASVTDTTLAKLFDAAWCQDPRWDSMPPPGQGVCCHREQGEVGIWAHPELCGELAMRGGGEAGERRFTQREPRPVHGASVIVAQKELGGGPCVAAEAAQLLGRGNESILGQAAIL